MKHLLLFSILAGAVWANAHAQVPVASLVASQSEISFVSRQMGVPVEGKFRRFDAAVALDPKQPEKGSVKITIDMTSGSFGTAELDMQLPKLPWFDAAKFPQASFQSSSIKPLGSGRFEVDGTLNIKGRAQQVVVPVVLSQSSGSTMASGSFVIKRLDYRIGDGEWTDTAMLANDVQVKFRLMLTGVATL